ncbi:MAG: zinc-ribbon domain containing protein [Patescibacteria group bacterium]
MKNIQCKNCHKTFKITDTDQVFYDRIDVPTPTLCPDCRAQRRMSHRNEISLYNDECDLCKKKILSTYSGVLPLTVYCSDCFYSDKWPACNASRSDVGGDARDYGKEFDFSQPFFEQYKELQYRTPRFNILIEDCENCDYSNVIGYSKNCYLIAGSINCEDCYYGNPYNCFSCVDSLILRNSELCYECINSDNLYNCFYCQDCFDSNNSKYCYDCKGCSDCMGCAGLRNKNYCINNKQYSEEEYKIIASKIDFCDPEKVKYLWKNFNEQKLKHARIFMTGIKNEQVSGNYINNSNNAFNCFDVDKLDNCKYINQAQEVKDSYDLSNNENVELCYEISGGNRINNCRFGLFIWKSHNLDYCERCRDSHDLFGCVSMNKQEYCILNKQYSKDEYFKMKRKIINYMQKSGEWGELFSIADSIFAYNETVAQDYFPMKEDSVMQKEWRWYQRENNNQTQKYRVLLDINQVEDDICKQVLSCKTCQKNYKIIPQELAFYKKQGLPIPKNCHHCRRYARMQLCTPRAIWKRECMCTQPDHNHSGKCIKSFETAYSPNGKELIYCEDCYNKETY